MWRKFRAELEPGHVKLRVHAVGFGFPDALIGCREYQVKPEPPFTPGSEVAGVVVDVASDVMHLQPGMRVLAMIGQGGARRRDALPALSAYCQCQMR